MFPFVPQVVAAAQAASNVVNSQFGTQASSALTQAAESGSLGSSFKEAAQVATSGSDVLAIGTDLKSCYASIKGKENAISQAYSTVTANPSSSSVSQVASAFKTGLAYFSGLDATSQSTLYQLLVVYLDERAHGDAATTAAQKAAYSTITPECDKGFQELTNAVDAGKSAMGLVDNNSTDCKNFAQQYPEGLVNVTLCKNAVQYSTEGQWYTNVTGMFSNHGDQICNVTFYIQNLDNAIAKSPSWLPWASLAYPKGIPTETDLMVTATIPTDVSSNDPLPSVEVLNNLYLCKPPATPAATAEPTADGTPATTQSAEQQMYDQILNSDRKCFLTDECAAIVAPFQDDQCEALRQVFLSECSTCSTSVMASAQSECLKTCGADFCMPKASAIKATSGASTAKMSAAILALVMAAAGFMA